MLTRITTLPRRFLLPTLLLVGLLCGVVAVAFHHLIYWWREMLIVRALHAPGIWRNVTVIAIPALVSALLAVLIRRLVPDLAGANLARIRRAYGQDASLLDWKTILATFVLTPISLGAGIPLGPEGPTVILTSGVALYTARLVRLPKRVARGMIPVGTAAGIAAIFNTPITGVVFALEEVLGTASRGILGGTIVAAVAAAVVERFIVGGRHVLATAPANWLHVWELLAFALVGALCGVVSGLIIPAVSRLRLHLGRTTLSSIVRAAIGGAMVGVIGLFAPATLSVGYEATSSYLHGGGTVTGAAVDFAAKTAGFVVSLASGLVGGVFAPSLFIGAALGGFVGHAADLIAPASIAPAPYAFVGMGALFAGLLRCPISSVLIVIELTGEYDLILPLMLATAISTALSRKISPLSLTERQLRAEGFREEHSASRDPLATLTVRDVMTANPLSVLDSATFGEVVEALGSSRHKVYPVVDGDGKLIGMLSGESIRTAIRAERWNDPIKQQIAALPLVVRPHEQVTAIMHRLAKANMDRCAVADDEERLVGFIAPEDILRARIGRLDDTGSGDRDFDLLGG